MAILSVNQASTNFAKLLERVEAGEEIAIALGLGIAFAFSPAQERVIGHLLAILYLWAGSVSRRRATP